MTRYYEGMFKSTKLVVSTCEFVDLDKILSILRHIGHHILVMRFQHNYGAPFKVGDAWETEVPIISWEDIAWVFKDYELSVV